MGNLSFFGNPDFLGVQIRGKQMAEHTSGKWNPASGWEDDTCVHVKPVSWARVSDGHWIDISDGYWLAPMLRSHPKVHAIAHSLFSYQCLRPELPNRMVWISQQHLNWERERRQPREVVVCGYIGSPSSWIRRVYGDIGAALSKHGFGFLEYYDWKTRYDCMSFFRKIDLLVIGPARNNEPLKTPAKLINAASFGIPAIAYKMPGYMEWEGNYVPVDNIAGIVHEAVRFKDPKYYEDWSVVIAEAAERYHISHVADRYRSLP